MDKKERMLIAESLFLEIETKGPGYRNSVYRLLAESGKAEKIEIDHSELMQLQRDLEKICKRKGYFLDYSEYDGLCVGLPYNLDFVFRIK